MMLFIAQKVAFYDLSFVYLTFYLCNSTQIKYVIFGSDFNIKS